MKKAISLWLILSLCNFLIAQDLPRNEETGKVEFIEVVNVDGATADQLYQRGLKWFDKFYTNANSVIEKKEAGKKIFGKHRINLYANESDTKVHNGFVNYYIELGFKDGKYRYKIDNFFKVDGIKIYIDEWIESGESNQDVLNNYLNQVNTFVDGLIGELNNTMEKPLNEESDDDW